MEKISGNSLIVKEVNINLVRKVLKEMKEATKQQIAEASALSIVTVGTVLKQLIKEHEVFESGLSVSKGGRPAQQYKYNAGYALALILYPHEANGVVFIHSTVVNLFGTYVQNMDEEVNNIDLQSLEQIIDKHIASHPAIRAIGLGLPGAEYGGKMIVSDYKALLGVSVTQYFSARYQRPVIIENDVNAAVIGFSKKISGGNDNTIVYLYFPENYPPGAGIFINGKLYKGQRNFAGEVALIPLGVSWAEPELYVSFDLACKAVAKLTIAISSILNPDMVILQGKFLNQSHRAVITQKCAAMLPQSAVPEILLSDNFAGDFLSGMIIQTLETLEPSIILARN